MALTASRWVAIAVGTALLGLGYFLAADPRREEPADPRSVVVERERELNYQASRAADKVRVATLADSVRRSLRALPPADSLRLLFGRGVPAMIHGTFREAVATSQRAVGTQTLPLDIAFVSDTGSSVRGANRGVNHWVRPDFILPATAGERCLVLIRLATTELGDAAHLAELASRLDARRLLGPCAYSAVFGQPGPRVAEWLQEGAWGFALLNAWTRASPAWEPPRFWQSADRMDALRWFMSAEGLRCATGQAGECEKVALRPRPDARVARYPDIWDGRVVSVGTVTNELWYRLSLGPHSPSVLSDMVHALGTDGFRRFWTSGESVPDAFRSASGRELGEFTGTWMKGQYGTLRRGPLPPPASVPGGLALLGIGIVAAVLVVRRRDVR